MAEKPKEKVGFYSQVLVEDALDTHRPDASYNVGLPDLQFWRPGINPKDTDKKTGLETLPSSFEWLDRRSFFRGMTGDRNKPKVMSSADELRRHIEALRAAKEYGIDLPKEVLNPKYLAAMVIKEGRPDLGHSGGAYNTENKQAVEVYNKLAPRFGSSAASFAAAVYDKGQVSRRLNIPFPMAWNGTGTVKSTNGGLWASGKNYAERFPQFIKAAEHPKNAQLVGFIDQYLNGDEYSTPLPKSTQEDINRTYQQRKNQAYDDTKAKMEANPLRQLQYAFLGGSDNLLGVPKEYDPLAAEAAVAAPNYDELRKQLNPTYKAGGSIENTTHSRKII